MQVKRKESDCSSVRVQAPGRYDYDARLLEVLNCFVLR